MTRVVPITNAAAERRAAIMGLPETVPTSEPMPEPVASVTLGLVTSAAFDALERIPGYWRGRANGRQAAVDFYRGVACDRAVTLGVDVSQDVLRDHAAIADYERRAEKERP